MAFKELFFVFSLLFLTSSCALLKKKQVPEKHTSYYIEKRKEGVPEFLFSDTVWVDSVFHSLSPDERIAQMFMVAAYSNKDSFHARQIDTLVRKYKIGGLIFMQGGVVRQARLTNYYQSIAKTPLLIAMDAEWGLSMRLDSVAKFPYQMTLGAVQDRKLLYDMGAEVARQCKRLGVHINFAPVVDINSNPQNPIINYRSFGEDKHRVAAAGLSYMLGMQENGILATAKHFPGHGDTDTDSHLDLPVIRHSRQRLDTLELYPFKELIKRGLACVMTAHLYIPSLDTTANLAATLSPKIVSRLLKDSLHFSGLAVTDALNMKSVTKYFNPGEADIKALLAGNDILLFSEDAGKAIGEIKKAVASGIISQREIDNHCRKILFAKRYLKLNERKKINIAALSEDINTPRFQYLIRRLYEKALTVLVNKNDFIPLMRFDTLKIASCAVGKSGRTAFQNMTDYYADVSHFNVRNNMDEEDMKDMIKRLSGFNLVLLCLHLQGNSPAVNYGITSQMLDFMGKLLAEDTTGIHGRKIILTVFGNPYSLSFIPKADMFDGIIEPYEDNAATQQLAAQLVFGGITSGGKLPVTAGNFKAGSGINTRPSLRLKYTVPEEVGINSDDLVKIDSIANKAISAKATPGCQILAAKEGKVFYYKSFGYFTYDSASAVKNMDIYDIASITKISATLPCIMKLQDEKKLSVDSTLGNYLPALAKSNKDTLKIADVLAHQAQLMSWIPFWMRTVKKGKLSKKLYSDKPSKKYTIRVADSLYLHRSYRDSIMRVIIESPLRDKREYHYSDLGFYLLREIVEKVSGEPMDESVQKLFYIPMGLTSMGYKPYQRFPLQQIVPTENDTAFRKQLLQGDVHDPGAAMLGGVGGHAGIFSDANDLAKLMQMYLHRGVYGGRRYFNAATVDEFTTCRFCNEKNRRGLGFDKPEPDKSKLSPACKSASLNSFGHTGYTGTMVWADPDEQLVYVFLSNRVHPSTANNKLLEMNIRTDIQQVIYDAVNKQNSVNIIEQH